MTISLFITEILIFFINCEFKSEFDNNSKINIRTNYVLNIESEKINKIFLLYYIDCLELRYKFCHINQMNINTKSDRCNMTYNRYMNNPMSMVERQINFNIAKNPNLFNTLDRTKNHPLIRNISHILLITNK